MKYVTAFLVTLSLCLGIGYAYVRLLQVPDQIAASLSNSDMNDLDKHLFYENVRLGYKFPSSLTIRLNGFRLARDQKTKPIFSADSATINVGWRDFLSRHVNYRSAIFESPKIQLKQSINGANWSEWTSYTIRSSDRRQSSSGWVFDFQGLNISGLTIELINETNGNAWSIPNVDVKLLVQESGMPWRITFQKNIKGKKFEGQADLNISAESIDYHAYYNNGEFEVEGDLSKYNSVIDFSGEFLTKEMEILPICSLFSKDCDRTGSMTGNFEFEGRGFDLDWKQIRFRGLLDIRSGMMGPYRFIDEALMDALSEKRFEELNNQSNQWLIGTLKQISEKPFDLLQTEVRYESGHIAFDGLRMKHPDYYLEGNGDVDIANNFIDFKAKLVLLESLSDQLGSRIPEIQSYKNSKGRMPLPFLYHGAIKSLEWSAAPSAGS